MLVFRSVHLFFFWSNHHLVLSKSMLAPLCELGLVYLRVTRVIVPPLQVRMVTCSFLERAFKGRVEQTSRTQKTYHGTSRGSAIFRIQKVMQTPSTAGNLITGSPEATWHPTFREAFRFWLKLGFISFGGPTGKIAIMHAELVERKKWISEARFLHALNYCMLLPGPEAQQLATYVGWLLHNTLGGLAAGAFFIIPSMLILWSLSYIYVAVEICLGSQQFFMA